MGRGKQGSRFLTIALLFLVAMLFTQAWEYYSQRNSIIANSRQSSARDAEYFKAIILNLVKSAEEGGGAIDGFIEALGGQIGNRVRMVHSEAINEQYGPEPEEFPINSAEEEALKDGKSREWETDDFFVFAHPLKAEKLCQECHHIPGNEDIPIPIGYPVGLVEVMIPKVGLHQSLLTLRNHTIQAIAVNLFLVLLFGYGFHRNTVALRKTEERTGAIVKSVGEGIIVTATDSCISFTNQEACRIFGYTEEEILNNNLENLISEEQRFFYKDGIEKYLSTGERNIIGNRVELEGLKKDGTVFPIEIRVEEASITVGEDRFFTAAIRDITNRKKMEKEVFRLADLGEDDPDPIIEIDVEKNSLNYCNSSAREAFPELTPVTPDGKVALVDWDHPLLGGIKPMVDEFKLDGVTKSLDLMQVEVGEKETESYKVFGRKLRYIPEENLLRIYTVDMTRQEELFGVTQQLLAEVGKIKQELEGEHREAESIGKSLFMEKPSGNNLDANVGVEPSSRAGGDRAGFINVKGPGEANGRDWLAVFDASGHGKGAAKFQEVALGALLALLNMGRPMGEALATANATLEKLGTGRFIVGNVWRVMAMEEKEAEDGSVWVEEFNIAQHKVMVLEPDSDEVIEWDWPGTSDGGRSLPMGLFDDGFEGLTARYRKVKNGSRTLTYTDGISEAANNEKKLFGTKMLKEIIVQTRNLPPDEASMEIVRATKCWVSGLPENAPDEEIKEVQLEDDITVAVIDIKNNGGTQNQS